MKRLFLAALTTCLFVGAAPAHFVFIVPDGDVAAKVIFSDSLKPDGNVSIEKIENSKIFLIDAAGKESPLKWAADKAYYKVEVPGNGSRIVFGVTDYGILQRGDTKPFWLKYHSKAIVGDIPAADKVKLGDRVPVEIVPIVDGKTIRFQALVAGKPHPKAEVSVMLPGDKVENLTTDEKGLTQTFEKAGQYGVRFRFTEAKGGEEKGKKFEEVRNYATLVVTFAGK
ncbi:MAG: DUF4198 domain-containing protein [Planctomycetes bacterium]|nr:DUF4198 domain-containing protein [Planctomycetota bacterium]